MCQWQIILRGMQPLAAIMICRTLPRACLHERSLPWLLKQVHNYPRRIVGFNTPMGFLYLQMFLIELDNYIIQWKLYWLSILHDIFRRDGHYFIQLICLKGIQTYAPFRVLH